MMFGWWGEPDEDESATMIGVMGEGVNRGETRGAAPVALA
jgi:hypothetical protein